MLIILIIGFILIKQWIEKQKPKQKNFRKKPLNIRKENSKKASEYYNKNKLQREKSMKYLKAKDLREHFKITSKQLYKTLELLKWTIKSGEKGWKATSLGINKGAKDGIYMGVSYVHWDNNIISNYEFIKAINDIKENKKININTKPIHSKITNTKVKEKNNLYEVYKASKPKKMTNREKKEKGDKYELFISKHYENQGYTISEHGLDNGVKDNGIDIIAKKEKELLFIQCKNWSNKSNNKVKDKEIKITRQDVQDYRDKNPLYNMYDVKIIYIMSENVLHGSAYHYIQEHNKSIDFRIIPMIE